MDFGARRGTVAVCTAGHRAKPAVQYAKKYRISRGRNTHVVSMRVLLCRRKWQSRLDVGLRK